MMTVAFKTFGCRLNHAETAQYEAEFAAAGFRRVPLGTPSHVIVVHSCAVTQKAESEGLKLLRALRASWPEACLVLVGCAVESRDAADLPADLVVHRDQKNALVSLVQQRLGLEPQAVVAPVTYAPSFHRSALKIQDGCDFFCAYCIVPHTRGQPVSRPFQTCVEEARAMIAAGFREIVVTGCNIACYRDGARTLVDLLGALLELPNLGRIRLGSIEPGTVERDVVALMATAPKLCKFLHLPIQSGDDGVLARMRRRYASGAVADTVREALRLMPNLGLGADFICGFPGETPEAFEATRAFVESLPFAKLHVFPYSERPGTPAAAFDGRVPVSERKRRAHELIALGKTQRLAFAQHFVGRPVEFAAEHFDKQGCAHGWSGEYLPCCVSGVPRDRLCELCAFTPQEVRGDVLCGSYGSSD